MDVSMIWVALTATVALAAALGAVGVLVALQGRADPDRGLIFAERQAGSVFLFDGDTLVDATPGARAILQRSGAGGAAWARLMAFLAERFPQAEARLAALADTGEVTLTTTTGDATLALRAEYRGGLTRIQLFNPEEGASPGAEDPANRVATEAELLRLRDIVRRAPFPIWRQDKDARVIWANADYLLRAMEGNETGPDLAWPLPPLFDEKPGEMPGRIPLNRPGQPPRWFDAHRLDDGAEDGTFYALPADAAVAAETALRDFMQTLTKTFAHLPIGLAIFDRQRQLAMFNPALMDFSGLPPDFLSLKPTLYAFLDAMRDRNMIPEPKDYRSWRRQMTDLEQAATRGVFEDVWTLPNGPTLRISGRPHPNGALALMFEDISTEMSRTRRFRANLEISQSVIDGLDDAIAVFSDTGQIVMANSAYADLWGHDPFQTLGDGAFAELASHWRQGSAPGDLWARLETFVTEKDGTDLPRAPLSGDIRLTDGRLLTCEAKPLAGGASMMTFRLSPTPQRDEPALRRIPA